MAKDDCVLHTGSTDPYGYGLVWNKSKKRHDRAHVLALEAHSGEYADGRSCLHTCDNPPCINPKHLWWGTQADNVHDMVSKGRQRGNPKVLTTADGQYIVEAKSAGASNRAIARYLGVSHQTINNFLKGNYHR
jgi:Helix-turn-helix domain/HNH endonuclease